MIVLCKVLAKISKQPQTPQVWFHVPKLLLCLAFIDLFLCSRIFNMFMSFMFIFIFHHYETYSESN